MDEKEIIKYLNYNHKESKIFVPNEIFNDLKTLQDYGSSHIAFTYSYYYFISWLYRYAKYGSVNIDVKKIKEILGYNENNKKINYIIKKDGILDQLGYTYSDTNYPIMWEIDNKYINFIMLDELDVEYRKMIMNNRGRNYKIKVPVKGLWRSEESKNENYCDGTFYEINNTHLIPFEIFIDCMSNKRLGVNGFYLYGYLKYKCQQHGTYSSSVDKLSGEVGMSVNTVNKYLKNLKSTGLIDWEKGGCKKVNDEFVKEAHKYIIKR